MYGLGVPLKGSSRGYIGVLYGVVFRVAQNKGYLLSGPHDKGCSILRIRTIACRGVSRETTMYRVM